MTKDSKIYIAGHRGLLGTALYSHMKRKGYENLLVKTFEELDLTNQQDVRNFLCKERPEAMIIVAANHGAVADNLKNKPEYLYDNTMILFNLVHAALQLGIQKIVNIGASCVYPEDIGAAKQYREEMIFSGPVQAQTEGYALAKAVGMKYCQFCNEKWGTSYITLLPVNLYGADVTFNERSWVLPALLYKFHKAKTENLPRVSIWGDGKVKREFLHVQDLVAAIELLLLNDCQYSCYNAGSGELVSIRQLAELIREVVEYQGEIAYDSAKPKGSDRHMLDCARLRELGWQPVYRLREGIGKLYEEVKHRL